MIRKEHYHPIKPTVIVRNETSGTELLNPADILLVAVRPKNLRIRIPINSCQIGHYLALYISAKEFEKKYSTFPNPEKDKAGFACIGKVNDKIDENGRSEVNIELTQYDETDWNRVLGNLEKRQNMIDQFCE